MCEPLAFAASVAGGYMQQKARKQQAEAADKAMQAVKRRNQRTRTSY